MIKYSTQFNAWYPSHRMDECLIEKRARNAKQTEAAIKYVKDFNLCIQAGGNLGFWPLSLSDKFKTVMTFEPDRVSFQCLQKNIAQYRAHNIESYFGALGYTNKFVGIQPESIGKHKVCGSGTVPVFTIDQFNLSPSFICLDVEGFELLALNGAIETINRARPIIQIEMNGREQEHGISKTSIVAFMESIKYSPVGNRRSDPVWIPNELGR